MNNKCGSKAEKYYEKLKTTEWNRKECQGSKDPNENGKKVEMGEKKK